MPESAESGSDVKWSRKGRGLKIKWYVKKNMRRSVKLFVVVLLLAAAVCVYLLKRRGKGHANVFSTISRQSTPVSKEPVVQAPSRPSDTSSPTTGAITKLRKYINHVYCRSYVLSFSINERMHNLPFVVFSVKIMHKCNGYTNS